MIYTEYHLKSISPEHRRKAVQSVFEVLKRRFSSQDISIAITGMSGIIGSIVAHRKDRELIIVRKDSEQSHSSYEVEYTRAGGDYVFVDDLIDSGKTVLRVLEKLSDRNRTCVGIILYNNTYSYESVLSDFVHMIPAEYKDIPIYCVC